MREEFSYRETPHLLILRSYLATKELEKKGQHDTAYVTPKWDIARGKGSELGYPHLIFTHEALFSLLFCAI